MIKRIGLRLSVQKNLRDWRIPSLCIVHLKIVPKKQIFKIEERKKNNPIFFHPKLFFSIVLLHFHKIWVVIYLRFKNYLAEWIFSTLNDHLEKSGLKTHRPYDILFHTLLCYLKWFFAQFELETCKHRI